MGEAKSKKTNTPSVAPKVAATAPKVQIPTTLTYGRRHIQIVLIGLGLIAIGLFLMSGGHMPSPDVWDESIIYSFRRTVLAPALIIAGLAVEIYAIFKK